MGEARQEGGAVSEVAVGIGAFEVRPLFGGEVLIGFPGGVFGGPLGFGRGFEGALLPGNGFQRERRAGVQGEEGGEVGSGGGGFGGGRGDGGGRRDGGGFGGGRY